MLHREHSDFQWFKERARTLKSSSIAAYTSTTTMATTEPSDPNERADLDLPPKSYADAVVTGPPGNGHERHPSVSGASSATAVDDGAHRAQLDEDKLVYEKHTGTNGGGRLTSVRPDDSYERALHHNGKTAPRNGKIRAENRPMSSLESGRKAGAGWQRSA
jgi:hypothetical protein